MSQYTSSSHNQTMSIETEFPADENEEPTQSVGLNVTGAFEEMELVDESSNHPQPHPPPQLKGEIFFRHTPSPSSPPPTKHSPLNISLNERDPPLLPPNQPTPDPASQAKDPERVYDRARHIYRNSSGTAHFLSNFRLYIESWGTAWVWITLYCILAIYPFAMLLIGGLKLNSCPKQPLIPIYLLVAGGVWMVKLSLLIYEVLLDANQESEVKTTLRNSIVWRTIHAALSLFLLVWFILGCVWTFGTDATREECDKVLYHFVFWTLVLQLLVVGIVVVGVLLLMACVVMVVGDADR